MGPLSPIRNATTQRHTRGLRAARRRPHHATAALVLTAIIVGAGCLGSPFGSNGCRNGTDAEDEVEGAPGDRIVAFSGGGLKDSGGLWARLEHGWRAVGIYYDPRPEGDAFGRQDVHDAPAVVSEALFAAQGPDALLVVRRDGERSGTFTSCDARGDTIFEHGNVTTREFDVPPTKYSVVGLAFRPTAGWVVVEAGFSMDPWSTPCPTTCANRTAPATILVAHEESMIVFNGTITAPGQGPASESTRFAWIVETMQEDQSGPAPLRAIFMEDPTGDRLVLLDVEIGAVAIGPAYGLAILATSQTP